MNWLTICATLLEVFVVTDDSASCHKHQRSSRPVPEMQTNPKMISSALLVELSKGHLSCSSFNAAPTLAKRDAQCESQGQPKKAASAKNKHSYLSLVLRIHQNRHFEVIKAALLPGRVAMRSTPTSDYIYEVYTSERGLFVGFLAEDPFMQRSLSDIDKGDHERVKPTSATTIVVAIPEIDEAFIRVNKLGLRLSRLNSPVSFDLLTLEVFMNLRKENQLDVIVDISPARLGAAIQNKMSKRAR